MPWIEDVNVPVADGEMKAALALPDQPREPAPGLLVLHELMGLNEDIRRIALRFAENGYAALAPDLYSVGPPRPICIRRTMQSLSRGHGRAFDDLEAAQRYLNGLDEVDESRLGVTGFCMGGSFAILHAVRAPLGAAAAFYADLPGSAEQLDGICPLFAGYGERDQRFARKPEHLRRYLEQLDVPHEIALYPDAGHSYMNQQRGPAPLRALMRRSRMAVGYHHDAAEDSWRRMLAFLKQHIDGAAAPPSKPAGV